MVYMATVGWGNRDLTERVLENAGPLLALMPPEQDEPNEAKAANEGENRDEDSDN